MTDFFRINMPYGMQRNHEGKWMFFNREYTSLGNCGRDKIAESSDYYCSYTGITEDLLLELATGDVERDSSGEITRIWFYDDNVTPGTNKVDDQKWNAYTDKLKKLVTIKRLGC